MAQVDVVPLAIIPGHHEAAAPAVLEALFRGVPGAVGEHGKLLWNTGNQRRAIEELQAAQKRQVSSLPHCFLVLHQWLTDQNYSIL